jgi:hypothetical protein
VKATDVNKAGDTLGSAEDYDGRYAVLPIALDVETWENLINDGIGTDHYMYDEDGARILSESDGILEVNLYPESWGSNPSNRGTIDLGLTNNSTADIARQILDGLDDGDMEAMGGELNYPAWFNGDPGLSAGIEDELEFIKGEPRMMPLFERTNNLGGGRLDYYVVDFVPIRILDVQLNGNPNSKHVTVQPATLVADEVISGEEQITGETVFSPGRLISND